MSELLPIETAPRDGTWLLLWDGAFVLGFWSSKGTWDDGGFHDDMSEITHWMPLPPPPERRS